MFIPKPIHKWIAVFRGEVHPLLILLSVVLGFSFGLMPGWYGYHVVLLVLALVINVHIGLFLLFAGFGKTLCYAGAPLLYHAGVWVQNNLPDVLNFLAGIPILGISDFSRYAIAGSLVIGPIVGLLGGAVLAWTVTRFRKTWLSMEEGSETLRKWRSKGWVRLLDRILIGKSVKDVKAVLKRRPKFVRVPGVVLAVLVVGGAAIGASFIQDEMVKRYATESLTQANRAEVNLDEVKLDIQAGRASISGIQVADPENPSRNRITIEKLVAAASYWDLSLGRLVIDEVKLTGVQFNQPREKPAKVLPSVFKIEPSKFDPSRFELPSAEDIQTLESYIEDAKAIRAWLETIQQYLPEKKAKPAPPAVPEKYLEYLTARSPLPPSPRILIKKFVLDKVDLPIAQLGESRIECINLSDAPLGAGLPVSIEVKSNKLPNSIRVVSHYEEAGGGAEVMATFQDVDLKELQAQLSSKNPVTFESGTVSGTIEGLATREYIDLGIKTKTAGMRARTAGGGLFGLDPQITSEAMKVLENLETTLRLVGPTLTPRLVFDSSALGKEFQNALVRAGKAKLAKRADELLGDTIPGVSAGKVLESPGKTITEGIGGLLGGQTSGKKDDTKKEDMKKEDKKKTNPLSGLKNTLKLPKLPKN